MPLPSNADLCITCQVPPQNLCMTFIGGAQMCGSWPTTTIPSSAEVARQFFGQIGTALAPLAPFFNLLDAIVATVACVQAVPDAILQLDPAGLIECAPNMVEAVQKLLAMVPQLSIPIMVKDIISGIIAMLQGVRDELDGMVQQAQAIAQANLLAQEPGNSNMLFAVSCAQDLYDKKMEHMAAGMGPLNQLMGILNMLLAMVPGVDPLPCLADLGGAAPEVVQQTLDAFITVLTIVRNLLPGGLKLNPFIPKGANC